MSSNGSQAFGKAMAQKTRQHIAALIHLGSGNVITDPDALTQTLTDFRRKILDVHRTDPPKDANFKDRSGRFIIRMTEPPMNPPTPAQLHQQAKRARPASAPGIESWKQARLAILPTAAGKPGM